MRSKAVRATDVLILNSTTAHNILSALCNVFICLSYTCGLLRFCPFEHHLTGEELFLRTEQREDLY